MLDAHARLLMVTCAYVTADLEHSTLAPLAGGHRTRRATSANPTLPLTASQHTMPRAPGPPST